MQIGDAFSLNLAAIFKEGFHEDLRGTDEYTIFPFTYGKIDWIGDGKIPGIGTFDEYDWVAGPFERITSEHGMLALHVIEINENEKWLLSEVDGCYGTKVKLSFDEFEHYAIR